MPLTILSMFNFGTLLKEPLNYYTIEIEVEIEVDLPIEAFSKP